MTSLPRLAGSNEELIVGAKGKIVVARVAIVEIGDRLEASLLAARPHGVRQIVFGEVALGE